MTPRHVAAAYSAVMSVFLLVEVIVEAARGTLLRVEAGRVSVWAVALLVLWLLAVVYVAWPFLRERVER